RILEDVGAELADALQYSDDRINPAEQEKRIERAVMDRLVDDTPLQFEGRQVEQKNDRRQNREPDLLAAARPPDVTVEPGVSARRVRADRRPAWRSRQSRSRYCCAVLTPDRTGSIRHSSPISRAKRELVDRWFSRSPASRSRSSAARMRACQIAGSPARSANSRYQLASSRSFLA